VPLVGDVDEARITPPLVREPVGNTTTGPLELVKTTALGFESDMTLDVGVVVIVDAVITECKAVLKDLSNLKTNALSIAALPPRKIKTVPILTIVDSISFNACMFSVSFPLTIAFAIIFSNTFVIEDFADILSCNIYLRCESSRGFGGDVGEAVVVVVVVVVVVRHGRVMHPHNCSTHQ
jgi:hypothetical protein